MNQPISASHHPHSTDGATALADCRVLLLPGWHNSGPDHWQSRWEALHGYRRVEQNDWSWPRRGDWMARLDEVLLQTDRPAVLVAHSLGCHLVAAWAAHTQQASRVRAALLVAPPDTERSDTPPQLFNWRPLVRAALPFASTVVASSDDPYCDTARAAELAADWHSTWLLWGAHGHLNDASGLGDWAEGRTLLQSLLQTPLQTPSQSCLHVSALSPAQSLQPPAAP